MASDGKKLQPIIVKKIKKGGHAVHGGAWKIAYADFVTAMMAFFLLMWLLGSTSEGDKKGLSDFFNTPLKVAMQGGSGAGASNSILSGGGSDLTKSAGQGTRGTGDDPAKKKMDDAAAKAEIAKQDAQRISSLRAKIDSLITSSPRLSEFRSQIRLETTPDGLQIQIVDEQNRPMFDSGSALVKPYMREILREIGSALNEVENRISLAGHTDSTPYGNGERGYSNWELSADRANASRRELVAAGMPDAKMARVVGLAASNLMDTKNPLAPVNRRISITIMTREAEERLMGNATIADPVTIETPSVTNMTSAPTPARGVQKP
ncbi:chemotaxis protein MotB [Rhodoferax sp. OV413]|uniref:flagellar motor protein MotB n=1 Tax=Rhodoferax sp. OV413 TaxID=1855285 RepID=UPI00088170DA|nr:flagellar motor protein MotB [Rhodoferax sp. OV413]SDP93395.1 chemotaxis protein MotB [Rhodoferax sp. OV413]